MPSRQQSMERVLRSYRLVVTWVVVVLLCMVSFTFLMRLAPRVFTPDVMYWVRCVAGVVLPAVLVWGYFTLRGELQSADSTHRRLLETAHTDALTGAQTRAYFLHELRQMMQAESPGFAYLQIDMDKLKVLNDTLGHGAGDTALVHLVRCLRALLPTARIGRLGGDEFGVIVTDATSREAMRMARRLLSRLREPISIDGRWVELSATVGVAFAPHDAMVADELVSKADLALYKGKKSGRATVVAFDPSLLADERYKRFVDRELRAAILTNQLEVVYQPIFSARALEPVSHEALVRWNHPARGRILPSDFIPVAEQSDLIDKLGEWVLRRACEALPELSTPTVGINVSVVQLRRPDFATRVLDILTETGVMPRQLVLEVTESLPLGSDAIEIDQIHTLRKAGVRIAIDDFGAGYASLEYLRKCPFDIIKIDRAYTRELPHSRIDGLIVTAICEIARALEVEVIAEGVETEGQLLALQAAGCTLLQGYLLGAPAELVPPMRLLAVGARS